jgi:SAM-dependent methyltransferase
MTQSGHTPDARRFAPAVQRNRAPLLEVFTNLLPAKGDVLEIASGTGEHAIWFTRHLPGLTWQASDPNPELRQSIASHIIESGLPLPPPLDIDVTAPDWPLGQVDAVICCNMIHIAPWSATLGLLAGAARHLKPGGRLCLYGPYKRAGSHTAPSNADFDRSLRSQNPEWGVRDLETVTEEALNLGLRSTDVIEMPSNNLTLVFEFTPGSP